VPTRHQLLHDDRVCSKCRAITCPAELLQSPDPHRYSLAARAKTGLYDQRGSQIMERGKRRSQLVRSKNRKVGYRNAAFPQKKRGEMLISTHPVSSQALEREIEIGGVNDLFAVRDAKELMGQFIQPEIHLSRGCEDESIMHRTLRFSPAPRRCDPSQNSCDSFKKLNPAKYKQGTSMANSCQRERWDHEKNSIRP
jgi:hypothetical protein